MKSFLQTVPALVLGILNGYDRLMIRGHLRQVCYA
jgi:hypothetical protein